MSIKQTFLQQTDNFINELCTLFSNNNDLLIFREKYNFAKSANSKIIIEYFIQYIYPLKQKIMNKDETFFLDGGGQEEQIDNWKDDKQEWHKNQQWEKEDAGNENEDRPKGSASSCGHEQKSIKQSDDQPAKNDQDAQKQDRQINKRSATTELDEGEGQMAEDTAIPQTNKTYEMDRMALEDPTKLNTRDVGTAMTQEAIVVEEQIEKQEMSNLVWKFHSE